MIKVVESQDAIEVQALMPAGQRVLFAALALFPLIAPYELIVRISWQSYLNVFFLFALAISLGAMAVSAFLMWAAVAGLSTKLRFDKSRGRILHSSGAPMVPWRTVQHPLDALEEIRVEKTEWSEGSPSYAFVAILRDRKQLQSGSSWKKEEIEEIKGRVMKFLG
jgi:hypothetical protein